MTLNFYKNFDDIDDFMSIDVEEREIGNMLIAQEALGWALDKDCYDEATIKELHEYKRSAVQDCYTRLMNEEFELKLK